MNGKNKSGKWKLRGLLLVLLVTMVFAGNQRLSAQETTEETFADYSVDRPLLGKGKSLAKAYSAANVDSLESLKAALAGSADEIYINKKITITENLDFPSGKLILRGYNCCYDTMFEIADGVTVTVKSDMDASGDQTRLYTGPVFDVTEGGKLQISAGSIYGSVSEKDGGAIVNNGTVEIKGGILQGHTTTKSGGAIYNAGRLTITGGQMTDNRSMAAADVNAGGAICNSSTGTLLINGGVIRNNYSLGKGGAVYNEGSLTIERGKLEHNKGQKKGNGICSTEDVTYTGNYYTSLDEVISEKNVTVRGSGFKNASTIAAQGFLTDREAGNNAGGKITVTALSGDMGNDGHIYYNGEGSFTGKVTGSGQFHTAKKLTIDAPAFACGLTVDKGDVTVAAADMEAHDIILSAGTVTGSGSGTVKVRNISIRGGTYIIENASLYTQAGQPGDYRYLDAGKIQCSAGGKLTVKGKNNPVPDGNSTYYVPVGRRVTMSQKDVDSALIRNSGGTLIAEAGRYGRSLQQESGVTYIKIIPTAVYNLKVVFEDENGKRQMFYKDGKETVNVSLNTGSGHSAQAVRIPDDDGFQTEGSENYGGYRFTSVPAGRVTVYAGFTDRSYRSLSGSIDLKQNDTVVLRVQKLDIDPRGTWWTDEGNYDAGKYNELKSAVAGDTIGIASARELAAVAKTVSAPVSGDTARNLQGIALEVTADIDLKGYQWKPAGTAENSFLGTFNGGGHTIQNMSIGFPEADRSLVYVGLFGHCGAGSSLSDIILTDYTIRSESVAEQCEIGGLAGYSGGKLERCSLKDGNMDIILTKESDVGGLAGYSDNIIDKCSVSDLKLKVAESSGYTNRVGGFIGEAGGTVSASRIEDSLIENPKECGGFVGYSSGTKFSNCFSSVTVKADKNHDISVGGFAYWLSGGSVENCYSTGDLSGNVVSGFVCGIAYGTSVANSYSRCNISGRVVAGFADYLSNATLTNCYASGKLTYSSDILYYAESMMAGFARTTQSNRATVTNCFFAGDMTNEPVSGKITSQEAGFIEADYANAVLKDNYTLADIDHKGPGMAGGFGLNVPQGNSYSGNFYYSNLGNATTNNNNTGITRILEAGQMMAGKRTAVTYTLHMDDLPGGAKVTAFRFDDNIPGASIRKTSETTYEVTPRIDFGVLHLTGEMTVSHHKLNQPEGEVPEGWDFRVSPEDTTMQVSEDLLLCKVDFEKEEILAPDVEGLKKNGKTGTLDADNNLIRFQIQDGDFANLIPFASPELQASIFIPERPEVPVVSCLISADKQLLVFTTDKEHATYTDENAIRQSTGYEYSLDGGKNYLQVTSTSDGKAVIPLTAGALGSWEDIQEAGDIKDARLRLAATDSSFRSKAMAEEAGAEAVPPEEAGKLFQVTCYWNNGTSEVYHVEMAENESVEAPLPPVRRGFRFGGWYRDRSAQEDGPHDFSQPVTENIKLYAHWEKVSHTIKTESDAGQNVVHLVYAVSDDRADAAAQGQFAEGTRIILEAAAGDDDYTFLYWKCGEEIISDQPVFEMEVTKDQTFTACFKPDKQKPDAPAVPVSQWITHSETGIKAEAGQEYAIRKMGETVYGPWQTSGRFTGLESSVTYQIVTRTPENETWAASDASQPLEVTTLKPAVPEEPAVPEVPEEPGVVSYTVTFMDGSTVLETETVETGKAAVAPAVQRAGYQLSWSIPYDMVTRDLVVRAVWKPETYTISFRLNGGKMQGNSKKTVVHGRTYGELPAPARKKYQFRGWYSQKTGGTKITEETVVSILEDTACHAQWTKISLKKPALKSVKNVKGQKMTVTWAKMSGVDGYRLEYSTSKKFTKSTTKSIKVSASKKNGTANTIKRLKKGKTYYVRVTAHKKDSAGKVIYSPYSTVKKVIIKK